jgi:hypothetical protein
MRFLMFILAAFLAGCAGTRNVAITPLPKLQVETADYTVGVSTICEIHHIQMQRTTVPIAYGLLSVDAQAEAKYAVSTNSFPHAETFAFGGCVVSDHSPKNAVIFICPECKKTAARWDSVYGKH